MQTLDSPMTIIMEQHPRGLDHQQLQQQGSQSQQQQQQQQCLQQPHQDQGYPATPSLSEAILETDFFLVKQINTSIIVLKILVFYYRGALVSRTKRQGPTLTMTSTKWILTSARWSSRRPRRLPPGSIPIMRPRQPLRHVEARITLRPLATAEAMVFMLRSSHIRVRVRGASFRL